MEAELALRSYQALDVSWLARILDRSRIAINLSEQRTGKLVEFIALCARLHRSSGLGAVLVVAPLSTLWNVRDEFERWLGWAVQINPRCVPGPDGRLYRPTVIAVNIERLRDRDHWLFDVAWDLVLLDEAHHYRGRGSQQTVGAMVLAWSACRVVWATATPLMNGLPKELWPLLRIVDPKRWGHFWPYLAEYADAVESPAGPFQAENAMWRKGKRLELRQQLAPLVVRRTYEEVYPELPAQVRQTIRLRLSDIDDDHWRAYKQMDDEWRVMLGSVTIDAPTKLAQALRLRQLAATPANLTDELVPAGGKVRAVVEFVRNRQGKVVVFCWHRRAARACASALGPDALCVTGEEAPLQRANCVRGFRQPFGPQYLVATIAALSEGQSLDAAETLVFLEKSWVPSENEQASMRIMGPGQRGSPLVVSFVCEDTIERHIEYVLAQKQHINSDFMAFTALLEHLRV